MLIILDCGIITKLLLNNFITTYTRLFIKFTMREIIESLSDCNKNEPLSAKIDDGW